jgi:uncharacterized protein (TIGR02118 family)
MCGHRLARALPKNVAKSELAKLPVGNFRRGGSMYKTIRMVKRRKELTLAQFKDYWLNNHSKLEDRVVQESPTQYIVATFAVTEPGTEPDMDGMVELYYQSQDDIRAMFSSKIPQMMRDDEQNFVQMDAPAIHAVTEEHLIVERPGGR